MPNEARFRAEVGALLKRLDFWSTTQTDMWRCPRCGFEHHPPRGRADIIGLHPLRRSIVVEVKMFPGPRDERWGATAFAFSLIRPEQRRYLASFSENARQRRNRALAGAFLAIGLRHGDVRSKASPRLAWLVPWPAWVEVEWRLKSEAGQKSLPLLSQYARSKIVRARDLCARTLLARHMLNWQKSIGWSL